MAKETKAERIRREQEGTYGEYNIDQLKNEIVRLVVQKRDHMENKKAAASSWNELIKDTDEKIIYCSERIDYLNHEDAVESHLQATGESNE